VTIVAQHLPFDPKDAYYASCWAVCSCSLLVLKSKDWEGNSAVLSDNREHTMLQSLKLIQGKNVRYQDLPFLHFSESRPSS
jgi:hypothetical protein